ncbi:MAG: DEAD/DEAH box helicase family protein [Synergistaceae bacterium]|nr:DEAD/DEAH box helicase family protein [Synergistaceae bacterium]
MIQGLRDYQVKAIRETYKWLRENKGNPCIVAPTGSGKAHIIAGFCEDILRRVPDAKILVLSHVKELLVQDAEKIKLAWPKAPLAIYSAGLGTKETDSITVAGIQSIWRKSEELGHIDVVIVDEAHMIQNEDEGMYRRLLSSLQEFNPKLRMIGLTATPYRLGQGLLTEGDDAIFQALIEPVTIEELVNRRFLARLTSTFTDLKMNVEGIKKVQGDYEKQELESRVNSSDINSKVVAETIRRAGNRTAWLVFCVSISHAEAMRDEFIAHGVKAAAITSKTSSDERAKIFADFKAGKIRAVTNVGVATTGFDYPDIDVIVMARPTLSPGLYIQMSGRGMRVKSPGHHQDCLVLDFAGNIARHGAVTKIIPPRRTVKTGKKSSQEISDMFKICPKCRKTVMKRARECVHCGHIFSELSDLSVSQDIMGMESMNANVNESETEAVTPPVPSDVKHMKVASWFWKVIYRKKDNMPILRVDFYNEDKTQGPRQLFLYMLHEEKNARLKAYRQLKSLLQGVKVPDVEKIDNAVILKELAHTITENFTPPSWIDYKEDVREDGGIHFNIFRWGWDEQQT